MSFETKNLRVFEGKGTQPGELAFTLRNSQLESVDVRVAMQLAVSTIVFSWCGHPIAVITMVEGTHQVDHKEYGPLPLPQHDRPNWRQRRALKKLNQQNVARARIPRLTNAQLASCLSSLWFYCLMQTHNDPYHELVSMRLKPLAEALGKS